MINLKIVDELEIASKEFWTRALVGVLVLSVLLAFLIVRAQQDKWWSGVSFGGEQGRYRVNGGQAGAIGSMGGLIGQPASVRVTLRSTIDVHLFVGYGSIVSSDPAVLRGVGGVFAWFSSTKSFEAVSPGTAELTTTASGSWGCAQISPVPPSAETAVQLQGKECPVLVITVSAS